MILNVYRKTSTQRILLLLWGFWYKMGVFSIALFSFSVTVSLTGLSASLVGKGCYDWTRDRVVERVRWASLESWLSLDLSLDLFVELSMAECCLARCWHVNNFVMSWWWCIIFLSYLIRKGWFILTLWHMPLVKHEEQLSSAHHENSIYNNIFNGVAIRTGKL